MISHFFTTGVHWPTFTTADDPQLKIYFGAGHTDDYLTAYVGKEPIASQSVRHHIPFIAQIHPSLLDLPIANGGPGETVRSHPGQRTSVLLQAA